MKKGDIALIVIAVFCLVLWLIPKSNGGIVKISVDGKLYREDSLNEDTKIFVKSQYGQNTVAVKNGEVFVTDADCPDELCEDSKISKNGESIVCLPNRLSVTVETEEEKEADVIL